MLGEIFGLSAGLTRVELTLFLFFGLRADFESFLPFITEMTGLAGIELGSIIGLGLSDMLAPGVLCGFSFGVFREDVDVLILDSIGLSKDASGRVRSSSMGMAM